MNKFWSGVALGIFFLASLVAGFLVGLQIAQRQPVYYLDEHASAKIYANLLSTYFNFTVIERGSYMLSDLYVSSAVPIVEFDTFTYFMKMNQVKNVSYVNVVTYTKNLGYVFYCTVDGVQFYWDMVR